MRYAVAPDDEHFYMVRLFFGPGLRHDVTVVQNFLTDVRARAGR